MPSINDSFWLDVRKEIDKKLTPTLPFIATVDSIVDGLVTIDRLGHTAGQETEAYARIVGSSLEVGDEIVCINIGGKPVIIDRLQTTIGGPVFDTPYVSTTRQNNADTSSTTSTTSYVTNVDGSRTLPDGIWTVHFLFSGYFSHSAAGSVDHVVGVDGNYSSINNAVMPTTPVRGAIINAVSSTGVDGEFVFESLYRVSSSGTAYAGGGAGILVAVRTS